MKRIDEMLLQAVGCGKRPVRDMERALAAKAGISLRMVRQTVRRLAEAGYVDFVYEHGCSFLVPGFSGPVRIGRRTWLCPPWNVVENAVILQPGVAFGTGRHATTRLCVRMIERVVDKAGLELQSLSMLDVGCGSGVLALTALRLGIGRAVGLDTDSCALHEARCNTRLNDLDLCMELREAPVDLVNGRFFLVAANLRGPTLAGLMPVLATKLDYGGRLVLSGQKANGEVDGLLSAARRTGFRLNCEETEQGWWAGLLSFMNDT